eukprot:UN28314
MEKIQLLSSGKVSVDDVLLKLTLLKYTNGSLQKIITSGNPFLDSTGGQYVEKIQSLLKTFGLQVFKQIPENNAKLQNIRLRLEEILVDAIVVVQETQKKHATAFRRLIPT